MTSHLPSYRRYRFMEELVAPNMEAEISHFAMTIPTLLGALLAKPHFGGDKAAG